MQHKMNDKKLQKYPSESDLNAHQTDTHWHEMLLKDIKEFD